MKYIKIIHLTNFIFTQTFFLIASYQILKNNVILINHGSIFQLKKSWQLCSSQFLEINSLMAKTIKNLFSKKNSYNQIAEFGNNLFILENWKRLSCTESFSWKNNPWFIKITSFFKIWYEAIRKIFGEN